MSEIRIENPVSALTSTIHSLPKVLSAREKLRNPAARAMLNALRIKAAELEHSMKRE